MMRLVEDAQDDLKSTACVSFSRAAAPRTTGLQERYATPKEYSGQDATFRYCVAIGIVFANIIQPA